MRFVEDPAAGAISTFSGVTRNNFKSKAVIKLEYECYTAMALKKLKARAMIENGAQADPWGGGVPIQVDREGGKREETPALS